MGSIMCFKSKQLEISSLIWYQRIFIESSWGLKKLTIRNCQLWSLVIDRVYQIQLMCILHFDYYFSRGNITLNFTIRSFRAMGMMVMAKLGRYKRIKMDRQFCEPCMNFLYNIFLLFVNIYLIEVDLGTSLCFQATSVDVYNWS